MFSVSSCLAPVGRVLVRGQFPSDVPLMTDVLTTNTLVLVEGLRLRAVLSQGSLFPGESCPRGSLIPEESCPGGVSS